MLRVRILVLWNACTSISREEDARWVHEETAKLRVCAGVRGVSVCPVETATLRHPRRFDWCLELTVDEAPNSVVRTPPCSDFLADLRLLGTKPSVLVLPESTA